MNPQGRSISDGAASILVFYGSYRSDRMGIRLANYIVSTLNALDHPAELVDAKAIRLPMLDQMYKEYPIGSAPSEMVALASRIQAARAFIFVTGEYNWGMQAGLKNLVDHFLEEWFWRPAAIASYSTGHTAGARANVAWHPTLNELGMVVISSSLAVGLVDQTLDEGGRPVGDAGHALGVAFERFASDLAWWADASQHQRSLRAPPY